MVGLPELKQGEALTIFNSMDPERDGYQDSHRCSLREGPVLSGASAREDGTMMGTQAQRVAVLIADLYEDLEFWYPNLRLREEGVNVTVVGPKVDRFTGKRGTSASSDVAARDVDPTELDGVVIPGGYAPDHMRRDPAMVELVRAVHEGGGLVAAICHAGWMLASAGIVKGRRVTGFHSIRDDMINAGAEFVDEEVVEDHRIITSRTPNDLPAFAPAILRGLRDLQERGGS